MLIVDENISEIETWRLREWGIRVRQVGVEIAQASIIDENIPPILLRLKHPTFFTRDEDFWKQRLAHKGYCLVFLDVREHEGTIAAGIRRFLHHHTFNTHRKRSGKVVRIRADGLSFWEHGKHGLQSAT